MAITWRNVTGGGSGAAAGVGLFRTAGQNINDGFDQFKQALQNEEKTRLDNWDQTKTNNTQNFLDSVAQYKTPEELQAAQAAGELDPTAQFGAQIDQAAVRGAADKQGDVLRDRVRSQNTYADESLEREQRGIVDQFQSYVAERDWKGAQGMLDNNVYNKEGLLSQTLANAQRSEVEEKHADTNFANSQTSFGNNQLQFAQEQDQRTQTQALGNMTQELIASGMSEQDIRKEVVRYAEANNINPEVYQTGITQIKDLYAATHDLTAAQSSALASYAAPLEVEKNIEIDRLKTEQKLAEDQNPIQPEFAFGSKESVSEGQAWTNFSELFDVKGGDLKDVQTEWNTFKDSHNLTEDETGRLLNEVLLRAGPKIDAWMTSDEDIFNATMKDAYPEWVKSKKNFTKMNKVTKKTTDSINAAEARYTAAYAKQLAAIKATNEFNKNIKEK